MAVIFLYFYSQIDMFMLSLFKLPSFEVGFYKAAFGLVAILLFIPGILTSVLYPILFQLGPFTLRSSALGSFGRPDAIRILWLGMAPEAALVALVALAEDLRQTLLAAGEALDTKPFLPHLTLARFPRPRPLAGVTDPPARAFRVDQLILFRSGPGGFHMPLRAWSLRRV